MKASRRGIAVAAFGVAVAAVLALRSCAPWADSADDREGNHDSPARPDDHTERTMTGGVEIADLFEAPVPAMCDNPAGTMIDGELILMATAGSGVTGLARHHYFTAEDWSVIAVGDVTGDGDAEGVAVLVCTSATGEVESQAVVYGAGPSILTAIPLDDAVGVRIHDGVVDAVAVHSGSDNLECCPVIEARSFLIDGDGLVEVGPELDATQPIEPGAWGPLRLGTTYADTALALGVPLEVSDPFGGTVEFSSVNPYACLSAVPTEGPSLVFLGSSDRTAVLYVDDPTLRTEEGIGIGSTDEQVRSAYGDRLFEAENIDHDTPDLYVGDPESPEGTPGIRFILSGTPRSVVSVMVGDFPYIMAAEGCA